MIEVAIMIEGQDGLNWQRWQDIAQLVEQLGFAGLYRSDHFTNASPPDKDSLELWVSFTWLATHTQHIEFGPLVTPASFRDPVFTARMAYQIDDLSGGRLTLGVGAGWQEREHTMFGYDLLSVHERMNRFEESLDVITGLLQSEEPFSYNGQYYTLREARLLPRPQRPGGPPILIGGNGPKRTLPLVAKYAAEWNAVYINRQTFAERNALLNDLLAAQGRQPGEVKRSLMTSLVFGKNDVELNSKLSEHQTTMNELQERGLLAGTASQIADQLGALAQVGVQRVMIQWLDLNDLEGLEAFARGVLGQM